MYDYLRVFTALRQSTAAQLAADNNNNNNKKYEKKEMSTMYAN